MKISKRLFTKFQVTQAKSSIHDYTPVLLVYGETIRPTTSTVHREIKQQFELCSRNLYNIISFLQEDQSVLRNDVISEAVVVMNQTR
jgi:hypothetical protein